MANEPVVTIVGNLTDDPTLRYTQSQVPVTNVTIASTPRSFDRQSNQWQDGETIFMSGSVWRDMAENVVATLTKGMRVIAQGRMVAKSFTDREGNDRTKLELQIDEIGPSLSWATAQVQRVQKNGGNNAAPQGVANPWQQQGGQQGAPQGWGTPQGQPPAWNGQQGAQPPQGGQQVQYLPQADLSTPHGGQVNSNSASPWNGFGVG